MTKQGKQSKKQDVGMDNDIWTLIALCKQIESSKLDLECPWDNQDIDLGLTVNVVEDYGMTVD